MNESVNTHLIWCVTLANTAAGVYTTLPWEYAATVDFSGDTLVFLDSAGAITAEIKIDHLDNRGRY